MVRSWAVPAGKIPAEILWSQPAFAAGVNIISIAAAPIGYPIQLHSHFVLLCGGWFFRSRLQTALRHDGAKSQAKRCEISDFRVFSRGRSFTSYTVLPMAADSRLESWKEIAAYLGREVRTVQLWEKSEELPIHRHQHSRQGTVYAFTAELDAWRETRKAMPRRSLNSPSRPPR
jgi:hypothetical protein